MRPNEKRARNAETMILIVTALTVLTAISDFFQYKLLKDAALGLVTSDEAVSNDLRQMILAMLTAAAYIVSIVTFIMWFRRAYYNQEVKFGQQNMNSTNGWASGAWFIPFYSLVKPFQLMREIYINAESFVGDANKNTSRLSIIGWWWAAWIIVCGFDNAVTRISTDVTTLDGIINATIADMIANLLYVPLAILAIKTIRNYNEMELIMIQSESETVRNNDDLLDTL